MGLFDMFVAGAAHAAGSAARNAVREQHKAEERAARELDRQIELSGEAANVDLAFVAKCESLGFDGGNISNYTCLYDDNDLYAGGRSFINAHRRKLDDYYSKLVTFVDLGGKPENLKYPDEIDQYLDKLKYLRSIGRLDYQDDDAFHLDLESMKFYLDIDMTWGFSAPGGFESDSLSGEEFEQLCKLLVESMGFTAETTKASGDGGVDILAYNHQPLLSGKYVIQCKRYSGSVGEPIIRDLYGVVMSERANKGILMTTGTFTRQAREFASEKQVELIDGTQLYNLIEQHGLVAHSNYGSTAANQAGIRYRNMSGDSRAELLEGLRNTYQSLSQMLGNFDDWGLTNDILGAFNLTNLDLTIRALIELEVIGYIDWLINPEKTISLDEADFINEVIARDYSIDELGEKISRYPLGDTPQIPYTALLISFAGSQYQQDNPEETAIGFFDTIGRICSLVMNCDIEEKRGESLTSMRRLFSSS